MQDSEKAEFSILISGVYAYHRTPISPAVIGVFWNGCKRWDMEQVRHAIDMLTADPEAGKFPPKIGDITRVLEGTTTDRSAIAWGKAQEAMADVGAYTDVVFDDPVIHAVIEDMGGWPKLARHELAERGYLQTTFCKSYRAYAAELTKGKLVYPARLIGERDTDAAYVAVGMSAPVKLIGDRVKCQQVLALGNASGKVAITHTTVHALAAQGLRRLDEPPQDAQFRQIGVARK